MIHYALRCKAVVEAMERIDADAKNVLLVGEPGSGKRKLARILHEESAFRSGPFVLANCALIPTDLVESELLGHRSGAFPGAIGDHIGRFELTHDGSLLLHNVDRLSTEQATSLSNIAIERCVRPLGGSRTVPFHGRLLLDTSIDPDGGGDLHPALAQFEDYRIHLPPLRDCRAEIPTIIDEYCERRRKDTQGCLSFSDRAVDVLLDYSWPGNGRELSILLERLGMRKSTGEIGWHDLPLRIREPQKANAAQTPFSAYPAVDENAGEARSRSEMISRANAATAGVMASVDRILRARRSTVDEKPGASESDLLLK